MTSYRVVISVHADYIVNNVMADNPDEAKAVVESDICKYLNDKTPIDYHVAEVVDVGLM